MRVTFKYDLQKDVQNIINTSRAKNDSSPTKTQLIYIEKYGKDFESEKVKEFIHSISNEQKTQETIISIQQGWSAIEKEFIKRVEDIFHIQYPNPEIIAYLSHNERCGYSIEGNYFFVNVNSIHPNKTIMHELLHFYTWHAFGDIGNDPKEALTVLLNIEFKDLMGNAVDNGYPQHAELREKTTRVWLESKDLKIVVASLKQ